MNKIIIKMKNRSLMNKLNMNLKNNIVNIINKKSLFNIIELLLIILKFNNIVNNDEAENYANNEGE